MRRAQPFSTSAFHVEKYGNCPRVTKKRSAKLLEAIGGRMAKIHEPELYVRHLVGIEILSLQQLKLSDKTFHVA